jgi:hypothetical protein
MLTATIKLFFRIIILVCLAVTAVAMIMAHIATGEEP